MTISSLAANPDEYEFLLSDKVKYKIVGTRVDKETKRDYIILRALIQ